VNHKQTYRQETGGRYIWSPKTSRNGARNQSYDNMRPVVTGDIVFSYAQAEIRQLGIVTRPAASCPKPAEFGQAGMNWAHDGWMVPVDWHPAPQPLRTKNLITELRPHLPETYSPLNSVTGNGAQNIYLAAVPDAMAGVLLSRLGTWAAELLRVAQGQQDRVRLCNRLRQQLWRYYPQSLELVDDMAAKWLLELTGPQPAPHPATGVASDRLYCAIYPVCRALPSMPRPAAASKTIRDRSDSFCCVGCARTSQPTVAPLKPCEPPQRGCFSSPLDSRLWPP
jgi:hypothetical protein